MTDINKADKAANALSQLHEELEIGVGSNNRQRKAIRDYLDSATDESLTRLYDILCPTPRPLGDVVGDVVGATENIGSCPDDARARELLDPRSIRQQDRDNNA